MKPWKIACLSASLFACVGDSVVATPSDGGTNDAALDAAQPDGSDGGGADSGPPAAQGKTLWVKTFGASDVRAVATDAAGNTYVTGTFSGAQADFGNGKLLSSTKALDFYVVKLDMSGKTLWAVSYGGTGGILGVNDDATTGIAVDPSGDVYVSGTTDSGSLTVGNTVTAAASSNYLGFIAKLGGGDGSGKWAAGFSTGAGGFAMGCNSVAASATTVYAGCTFDATTLVFNGGTLTNNDNQGLADLAVVAFATGSPTLTWANGIGQKGASDGFVRLALDASGDVLVGGGIGASPSPNIVDTLGSISVLHQGTGRDAFYSRLSATNGKQVWTKVFGGAADVSAYGVASDRTSSLTLLGGSFKVADLGAGPLAALGTNDAYVVAFDGTTKNTQFVKTIGGNAAGANSNESTTGLAFDAWGEIVAVGINQSVDAKADGKPISGPPADNSNATFVVKYGAGGNVLWAKGLASGNAADSVAANGVAVVPNGELRVGGAWRGTAALDGATPVTSAKGEFQAFVIGIGP